MNNKPVTEKIAKVITTIFYLGYIPLFPSSSIIGSVIGVGVFLIVKDNPLIQLFLIILLFFSGVYFSRYLIEERGNPDPPEIIIDEVCGIMVALVTYPVQYAVPLHISTVILAFFLFHLFDAIKIFPLRRLEKLPSGWGVMTDDLMAGVYTNVIIHFLLRVF